MFNNPYNYPYMNMREMTMNPYISEGIANFPRPRPSFFKGLSNIKWGNVLNNTQKTLNVINQAIPVYYQIKPIFSNVKSFGRLISAFNSEDTHKNNNKAIFNNNEIKKENSLNSPTFFIN